MRKRKSFPMHSCGIQWNMSGPFFLFFTAQKYSLETMNISQHIPCERSLVLGEKVEGRMTNFGGGNVITEILAEAVVTSASLRLQLRPSGGRCRRTGLQLLADIWRMAMQYVKVSFDLLTTSVNGLLHSHHVWSDESPITFASFLL